MVLAASAMQVAKAEPSHSGETARSSIGAVSEGPAIVVAQAGMQDAGLEPDRDGVGDQRLQPAEWTVGTKAAPPFAIKSEDGSWQGISIDLWRRLAEELGVRYSLREFETADELVEAAAKGEIQAGISALSVTEVREKIADFSHPYYQSGLSIAVNAEAAGGWFDVLQALGSRAFLATVGALTLLLFVTGALMWLIERRANAAQFPEDPMRGVGTGFWWSAVTMTTVGYGDKAPVTPIGRAVAVVWMFAALILTALFTAQLTSALTINQITGPVRSVADLNRVRVGVIRETSTQDYFRANGQRTTGFETLESGLIALKEQRIEAFVHDEPILRYVIRDSGWDDQLIVLPDLFQPQVYAIVMPEGRDYREKVNRAILSVTGSEWWPAVKKSIRVKYLGAESD